MSHILVALLVLFAPMTDLIFLYLCRKRLYPSTELFCGNPSIWNDLSPAARIRILQGISHASLRCLMTFIFKSLSHIESDSGQPAVRRTLQVSRKSIGITYRSSTSFLICILFKLFKLHNLEYTHDHNISSRISVNSLYIPSIPINFRTLVLKP